MSPYKVMVDDNFHYMDADERYEHGTFETAEAAVAACRRIVDDWLAANCRPGMSAAELYQHYVAFGDDPFVVAVGVPAEATPFSARDYAKARADILCRDSDQRPR